MGTETPPEIKQIVIRGTTVAVVIACNTGTTGEFVDYWGYESAPVYECTPANMYPESEPSWQKLNKGIFSKKQRRGKHAY